MADVGLRFASLGERGGIVLISHSETLLKIMDRTWRRGDIQKVAVCKLSRSVRAETADGDGREACLECPAS